LDEKLNTHTKPLNKKNKKETMINMAINMVKIFSLMLLSILIISSFTAVFSVVSATDLVEDSWNTKNLMSQARFGLGVVAVGGKIYAIGGSTIDDVRHNRGVVGVNECYDPMSDTWITLKPMPTPRTGFAIAAYEGKIYCMGGTPYLINDDMKPRCDITEVYDTATNTWSTKASMPFKGSGLIGLVVDGKIFVIDANMMFMYDPATDTWTRKPDAPYYLFSPAASVVDDKIILAGNFIISPFHGPSRSPIQYAVKATMYDLSTDTWSEGKTDNTFESGYSVAEATTGLYAPQKIYVFSGTADNMIYEPTTDTWSAAKPMPSTRIGFGVAALDDILYVIGGYDYVSGTVFATNKQYIPIGYHGTGFSDSVSGFSVDNLVFVGALVGTVVVVAVAISLVDLSSYCVLCF
jgi:N-acetylneuraminic acid mutarotase